MRNVVQFKDKNDELYAVKDIVARGVKANAVNLFNYKNASGEVVSVDDAVDESLLKLRVQIKHVQDMHGYDNPWPGGRGKNLNEFTGERTNTSKNVEFSASVGSHFAASGTANGTNATIDYTTIHPFTFIAGTKYIFSFTGTGINLISYVFLYDDNKAGTGNIQITNGVGEFVPEANASASYIRIRLNTSDGTAVSVDCNWQVEISNSATAWSPYENICPITGSEKCRIVRIGEDLIDPSQITYNKYIDTGGSVKNSNSGLYYTGLIPVVAGKSYVLNVIDTIITSADATRAVSGYKADGTFDSRLLSAVLPRQTPTSNVSYMLTIPDGITAVRINSYANDGATQFFEGTSTKNVFDIPFSTPPGTVYDGELVINQDGSGVLTVNSAIDTVSDLATYTSFTKGTYTCVKRFTLSQATNKCALNETHGAIASFGIEFSAYWGTVRANEQESKLVQFAIGANGTIFTIYDSDLSLTDETFMQKYGDQQVCYPLDTPITYELSNQQIVQLLEGHNTLWANTGSIEIDYPVEKLISKKEADERYAGMVYIETESAAVIDISDGADEVSAKELAVDIETVQDFHGYDNPWPAGGGKNLFGDELENGTWRTSDGVKLRPRSNRVANISPIQIKAGTYTISCVGAEVGNILFYQTDGTFIEAYSTTVFASYPITFTINEDRKVNFTFALSNDADLSPTDVSNVQLEAGSTATDYAPYENICPIDGWDSADVERIGKNIFNKNDTSLRKNNVYLEASTGRTLEFVNDVRCVAIPCKSSQTYTISNGVKTTMRVASFTKNPPLNTYPTSANSPNGQTNAGTGLTITTGENDTYLVVQVIANADVSEGTTFANAIETLMIEEGSTVSPYKAYQGATYSYPFPETIYDGTLVIHQDGTGALTSDNGNADLGTLAWTKYDGTGYADLYYTDSLASQIGPTPGDVTHGICSDFVVVDNTSHSGVDGSAIAQPYNSIRFRAMDGRIYLKVAGYSTAEELTQALNGVQLVYELATPIVYSLANQQVVELLRGENHIWANCGNVKVTYPADTEIYIQKKVDSIDLDSKADKANPVFTGSISMGRNTAKETGQSSVATGMSAAATATGSHAEGYFTEATGEYSHAEGYEAKAYGRDAHAEGRNTLARANDSHAEGYKSEASGLRSHAEGYFGKATGDYSHAEGYSNKAIGKGSHAEGYYSEASGEYSHVEGNYNGANGSYSHVFGKYASGDSFAKWAPHFMPDTEYAVGDKVWSEIIVMGEESVEIVYEGYVCKTAHTSGSAIDEAYWTKRNGLMKYAEIVGNGTGISDALRSNARALDWDGNEYLNGDLYVKCNPDSTGGVKAATMNDIADLTKVTAPIINVEDDTPEAIKTIHDGAEGMPVKQLTVNIEPVQDLHGYDNPWPAGGWKNLYNKDGTDTANGYVDGKILKSDGSENVPGSPVQWELSEYIEVSPSTSYVISGQTNLSSSGIVYLCEYDSSKNFIKSTDDSFANVTFTTDQNTKYVRLSCKKDSNATRQLEQGSTATSYAPYSNLCHISGWTSADVTRTGKNLFDKNSSSNATGKYLNYNTGELIVSGSGYDTSGYISVKGNVTYTVLGHASAAGTREVCYYDKDKAFISGYSSTQRTFTTPYNAQYIRVDYKHDDLNDIQIVLGSSAVDYDSYNGTQYQISFPSEAGMVYGATLTINQDGTGTLLVKRAEDDLGARDWAVSADNISFLSSSRPSGDIVPPSQATMPKVICDIYRPSPIIDQLDMSIAIATSGKFKIRDSRFAQPLDATAFKTAMNGVKAVYELAEPVSYELTSQQVIELLKGTNNIWSNAGDTAIKYAADTKLYIDLKFAELQALILENISNS